MTTTPHHCFLWFDAETTGVDPNTCEILEWAAVLAADDQGGDMSAIETFGGVLYHPGPGDDATIDPFVVKMHTQNGLWAECAESLADVHDAELELIEIVEGLGAGPRSVVLAGSTVAFDWGFLRVHMPKFFEYLSHRCFDVSTLKMAERDWLGGKFKKAEAHRALPDILESLAHAAEIRALRWAP